MVTDDTEMDAVIVSYGWYVNGVPNDGINTGKAVVFGRVLRLNTAPTVSISSDPAVAALDDVKRFN